LQLLIDTNVLVWLSVRDRRLPSRLVERIESGVDQIFVSVVSGWEYGQKRLKAPETLPLPFAELTAQLDYHPLDFAFKCHSFAEDLPKIHSDPFDRMLIAQALHHDLTFVASDAMIHRYPVKTMW
jgi:PIN domain nuclease of toxin-antitoxin system